MSQRLVHVCKICGKKFATTKALCGHMRIHSGLQRIWGGLCSVSTCGKEISIEPSETLDVHHLLRIRSSLFRNLHFCKICGKKFATSRALCGHLRIHSRKSIRMEDDNEIQCLLRICDLCSVSSQTETLGSSLSSSMTEVEQLEMNEAAMCLVMFSEQVYDFAAIRNLPPPPGDDSTYSELNKPMQEKISPCVDSKLDFTELLSHSGFENSTTFSDVVAHASPSPLTSKSHEKPQSNSSRKCKICGKTFGCYQALGGQQRLHRSIRGQLARKKEDFEGDNSLSGSSEAKKIVPQPSCSEVSQEELIELRDANVKEYCVESKQEFGEVFSLSGFEKSSTCTDVVAQALPSLLRSKLQGKPQSNSNHKCKICGKTFGCSQALGGHQRLHRSTRGQLARKRRIFEDGNSLSSSSEAKKIFSQESSFEVSR